MTELIAYSTPQALDNAIAARLLSGNDSVAKIVVRGRDNRERGVTVLFSSHLLDEVERAGDAAA